MSYINTIITGTGSYIPTEVITNPDFADKTFYDANNVAFEQSHEEISEKFHAITGISERRWVTDDLHASDIASMAAERAISDAGIDPEELDQIIVAHDFGDVKKDTIQMDTLPSISARVKHNLKISNPKCVAYDLIFGCPGWIQGVIHADSFMRNGMAKKCLVIGAETLSRVIDIHDRDSMIYADGAGATIIELVEEETKRGILSFASESYTKEEAFYLYFGKSNIHNSDPKVRYLKMHGRKIYEFSLKYVPRAVKECMDKAELGIASIKKIFIHQANEKMDQEIVKRLFRLYGLKEVPDNIMPMSIHKLGNNSVATVPTLLDLVRHKEFGGHKVAPGDHVVFTSVGAGMNINAIAYKF
ncbi:MAG: ketoacyl-ACP synthase III [Bacteroidales bacterium]|nr:ketoacyl-ACP synthase III [Bacteroidales bacterium]MCF8404499.1 ketoacyl-ACP synthase III [Bacteroidales bacterium]